MTAGRSHRDRIVHSQADPAVASGYCRDLRRAGGHNIKEPLVKLFQISVDGFIRAATEMGRNALPSPLELPLVEEP